jgi:hypothetical protein
MSYQIALDQHQRASGIGRHARLRLPQSGRNVCPLADQVLHSKASYQCCISTESTVIGMHMTGTYRPQQAAHVERQPYG